MNNKYQQIIIHLSDGRKERKMDIQKILGEHELWLADEGGRRADLRRADLRSADLRRADLRSADLRRADLRGADLGSADLGSADLGSADLREAGLRGADLSGAGLRSADLRGADLSGAHGLLSPKAFLSKFKRDANGAIICYKTLGEQYNVPDRWVIAEGSFITEVCNPNRTEDCGCGANVATLEWVMGHRNDQDIPIWECRILPEDVMGIVVPYNTDGKFRADRVQLIGVVTE